MEQIDIKYSNIIRDELNVYDIYNTYVSLLDGKKLKSYFQILIITIIIYILSLQPEKSNYGFFSVNNFRKIIVFCFIYFNLFMYLTAKFNLNIDRVFLSFYNRKIKKYDNKYLEYNQSSNQNKPEYILKDKSFINTIINSFKGLIYILLFVIMLNLSNIDTNGANKNLISIMLYIILFGIIFYLIIEYLFDNYIKKNEYELDNKNHLINIIKQQKQIDSSYDNVRSKFNILYKADLENHKIDSVYGILRDDNYCELQDKLYKLQTDIEEIYTIQQKESLINSSADIIENIENSKLLLSKDNNKYKNEIIYTNELKEIFKVFYFNYNEYLNKHYIANFKDYKNKNYLENKTYNFGNIEITEKSTLLIDELTNTNIYKLYNIRMNINNFINNFNKLDMNIKVQYDDDDNVSQYIKYGINSNDKNYELLRTEICKNNTLDDISINSLSYALENYLRIDLLNYKLLAKAIIQNISSKQLAPFIEISQYYSKEVLKEIDTILDNLDILNKIYYENSNELDNLIDIREAEKLIKESKNAYNIEESRGDRETNKKIEYFKAMIIPEINLFNNMITNRPFKEDDLKLIKANKFNNYKFSKYIYEYYAKSIDTVIVSLETTNIENLQLISKEQIYRSFIEMLTVYKRENIDKERILKNYKRLLDDIFITIKNNASFECNSKLKLNIEINQSMSYVNHDVFESIINEKNLKDIFDELCKLEKIKDSFEKKYEPLITYELNVKKENKQLIINIINIFIVLILVSIVIYIIRNISAGLFSEQTIWSSINFMIIELTKMPDFIIEKFKKLFMYIIEGHKTGIEKSLILIDEYPGYSKIIIFIIVIILITALLLTISNLKDLVEDNPFLALVEQDENKSYKIELFEKIILWIIVVLVVQGLLTNFFQWVNYTIIANLYILIIFLLCIFIIIENILLFTDIKSTGPHKKFIEEKNEILF